MKLRCRILLFISVTLIVLVVGVYGFSTRLLMQSYNKLEHQDAAQNTDRASRAFLELDDSLHDKAIDWADWDDTYQFMVDHNQAYIKSNLVTYAVAAMKMDMILYVDIHGRIFHQFTLKRFPELPPPDGVEVWHTLSLDRPDAVALRSRKAYSGLILHRACPLLVSVRPILTSKGNGPARGWLVFGRYFDTRQQQHLAEQTRLNVQTYRLDLPAVARDYRQVLAAFSSTAPVLIRPQNAQTILGYSQLLDVQNRPALLLKVTLPRHIHQQGVASSTYLMRLIFLAVLVFGAVVLLVIEFSILSRLTHLTRQVEQIGEEGTSARRVLLPGRDELTSLATRVNEMLQKLDRIAKALFESREELAHQNENLEVIVAERTQELLHQALHDGLTGLPNRAQVTYHLEQIAKKDTTEGKAVLFLDLDNFKFINDSLGHGAGDALLVAVAERLKRCVRPEDMVARLGGDEFLIVLEAVENATAVIQIAERILEAMLPSFSLQVGEGFTSTSIGIAYTELGAIDPDILIRDADTAMYQAKSSGKAAFALFESGMNDRLVERVDMELGLRVALEQNEFCVHYQPLIDLQTGHLSGVEALVRWQHPKNGLIAPGRFIPIAEETGLIIPIGYWVLEEACRQAMAWKQAYPNHGAFTTSVNLSGKQLQKPDVVERVREILVRTGLPAEELKLEITESVMMEDVTSAISTLKQLKSLGVQLALDDFGTGYSSMASLSSFPLDTVKIDRAFVARLNTSPDAESVIAAIIFLAKSLSIDVTGEGIETSEQLMTLQGLGCHIGQGYFFDRPLNAAALEDRMTTKSDSFVKNYTETDGPLPRSFEEAA